MVATLASALHEACLASGKEGASALQTLHTLEDAVNSINPLLWSENVPALFSAADSDGDGVLSDDELVDLLGRLSGLALPDGVCADTGASDICTHISAVESFVEEHAFVLAKAPIAKTALEGMRGTLDPKLNPDGYHLCQNVVLDSGRAIPQLLNILQFAPTDELRSMSIGVLLFTMFGNEEAAPAVALNSDFVPAVLSALQDRSLPLRLSALQLVQAVASSDDCRLSPVLPPLLTHLRPMLENQPFSALSMAALDAFISASFHCPSDVADILTWPFVAALISEDADRPNWLPLKPLEVLSCGLLAVNLLKDVKNTNTALESAQSHDMLPRLCRSAFIQFLALAFEAAVDRREWPLESGVFHSPRRLSLIVQILASTELGDVSGLVTVVEPLAKVVQGGQNAATIQEALRALLALCKADVGCLEAVLNLEAFWREHVFGMHQCGESDASALFEYLAVCDDHFSTARMRLELCQTYCNHAPSVPTLARVFARFAHFDEDMPRDQFAEALQAVPIGPTANVFYRVTTLSFATFAEQIYGTAEILGLWPNLMEDVTAYHAAAVAGGDMPLLPTIAVMLSVFDMGAAGDVQGISPDKLLTKVLPAFALPGVDNQMVADAFSEVEFEGPMHFKAFVQWVSKLCLQLSKEMSLEV